VSLCAARLFTFWLRSLTVANDLWEALEALEDLGAHFAISSAFAAEQRMVQMIWFLLLLSSYLLYVYAECEVEC